MKLPFQFSLPPQSWAKTFWAYWAATLVIQVLNFASSYGQNADDLTKNLVLSLAFVLLSVMLSGWFTVFFLRAWFSGLSVDSKRFQFHGDPGDFLKLNLIGLGLSVVTLGIYLPWYERTLLDYQAKNLEFEGSRASFRGKPGRLLVRGLLLFVALVGLIVVAGVGVGLSGVEIGSATLLITAISLLVVFVFSAGFVWVLWNWSVDFDWNTTTVVWGGRFWPTLGFVLGQLLLAVITLGIAWPVVSLAFYREFLRHVKVQEGEAPRFSVSYARKSTEGFLFLWGQGLLCLVTVGIYFPWAVEKVGAWLAEATWVEDGQAEQVPQELSSPQER
jgi:uncharacterized membrane protein YjgN (DUF898 family)